MLMDWHTGAQFGMAIGILFMMAVLVLANLMYRKQARLMLTGMQLVVRDNQQAITFAHEMLTIVKAEVLLHKAYVESQHTDTAIFRESVDKFLSAMVAVTSNGETIKWSGINRRDHKGG